MERRTQVDIECPECHWKRFVEVEMDETLLSSPLYKEIKQHLEAWVKSQCPDHLGLIANMSKN